MEQNAMQMVQKTKPSPNSLPNKPPKKTRNRNNNDPLSRAEVESLLSKVTGLREYTVLLFGFSSGVRVSELAFDYNAVNWDEGFIRIFDKKKEKYRKIYVPETVLASLKRYWLERGDKKSPRFFDFGSKTAERIIQYWSNKVLAKTKSWHCVRHTYVTLSFESQVPISVVIENTGDAPATILEYYTKLSPTFIKTEINSKPIFKVL